MTGHNEPGITVYWRSGCPFCSRLRRKLARAGVITTEVNIWDDPSAAAFVRSVAGGNETVPTVTVGTATFVNPTPPDVIAAAGRTPVGRPSRLATLLRRDFSDEADATSPGRNGPMPL